MILAPFKFGALFGASLFGVGIIAAAISVYGLDNYEPQWGRGISFQVEAYFALGFAIIGAIGSGLAFRLKRITQSQLGPTLVILSGALLLALSLFLAGIGATFIGSFGLFGVAVWSFFTSFGTGLGLVRLSLREPQSAT